MPAAFSERLVTPSIKGSKRMGLQLWWASEGVKARTEACREGNRCGVYSREDQLDTGKAPKCAHCNAAHYRTPCTCDGCAAAAAALATVGATPGPPNQA